VLLQKACIPRTIMNVLEKDPEEEKRKQEEQRNIEEGQNFIMLQPHQIKQEKMDQFELASQKMPPPKDVIEVRTVQVLGEGGQNQSMEVDRQRQEAEKQRSVEDSRHEEERRRREDDRRRDEDRRKKDEYKRREERRSTDSRVNYD